MLEHVGTLRIAVLRTMYKPERIELTESEYDRERAMIMRELFANTKRILAGLCANDCEQCCAPRPQHPYR